MCPVGPRVFIRAGRRTDRQGKAVAFRSLANAPKSPSPYYLRCHIGSSVAPNGTAGVRFPVRTDLILVHRMSVIINAYCPTHANCITKSRSSYTSPRLREPMHNSLPPQFAIPPATRNWSADDQDMGFPFLVGELRNVVFPFIMWLPVFIAHVTPHYDSHFAIPPYTLGWMSAEHDTGFPFVVSELRNDVFCFVMWLHVLISHNVT